MDWKPITEPPAKSGRILVACMHHRIPMVLEGHCKLTASGPVYSENTYHGQGIAITHWMPLPMHPYAEQLSLL